LVEQKNGAVVRRMVGYRRFEGLEAAALLAALYRSSRLFVNFFQPSFKLHLFLGGLRAAGASWVDRQKPCLGLTEVAFFPFGGGLHR
jgi:hypothetical protein